MHSDNDQYYECYLNMVWRNKFVSLIAALKANESTNTAEAVSLLTVDKISVNIKAPKTIKYMMQLF